MFVIYKYFVDTFDAINLNSILLYKHNTIIQKINYRKYNSIL